MFSRRGFPTDDWQRERSRRGAGVVEAVVGQASAFRRQSVRGHGPVQQIRVVPVRGQVVEERFVPVGAVS